MKKTVIILLSLFFISTNMLKSQEMSRDRNEIPDKYKWNFEEYYNNWDEWELDFEKLKNSKGKILSYEGTLSTSAENLYTFLKTEEEMGEIAIKVYCYPYLLSMVDSRDQAVNKNFQNVQIFFSKVRTETSWRNPEILKIPEKQVMGWIDEKPELENYRFNLSELYRMQEHVYDDETESLMSYYSPILGTAREIYNELTTSDIKYEKVTLSDGKEYLITSGEFGKILSNNKNQEDRKLAFEAFYNAYKPNINTFAAIYKNSLQTAWTVTQARKYNSCIDSYLEGGNIPVEVYTNLINTSKSNLEPLFRYYKLRKQVLGLEEYHPYDGTVGLIDFEKQYSYDEATQMVVEAVAPLGEDYQKRVKNAFENGWVDVFESEGKRTGASNLGVYGVHPFVKMNWNYTLRNVFTLAHELGHSMHAVLTAENQSYFNSGYSSMVAEVASTFNERLLLDYLLSKSKDPKEKIALIDQAVSNLVGKFYRQSMYADFELEAHKMVEKGMPINKESLGQLMQQTVKTYYGDDIVYNENLDYLWAIIPHYYTHKFYVYYYATSYAASAHLYNNIANASEKEKKEAVEKYLNLLKSGGSEFPIDLLNKAGVDMAKPETILVLVNQMNELLDLLEKELEKI